MIDKQTKYRAMAQRLVAKYTSGICTLKHVVSESYDAKSGVKSIVYQDPLDLVNMVIGEITDNLKLDKITSDEQMVVYIAGDDVPSTTPAIGDVIVTSGGKSMKILKVIPDQYRALFTAIVHRK